MSIVEVVQEPDPETGGVLVLRSIVEEVALPAGASDFKAEILKLMEPKACRVVVIDLNRVRHFGTDALAVLLAIQKRLAVRGGGLRLCRLDPEVEQSFRLCMLHRIIGVYPTLEEALA